MRTRYVIAALLGLGGACLSPPDAFDYDAVIFGGAADAKHPYVGQVVISGAVEVISECSGTGLSALPGQAATHFLTARHCGKNAANIRADVVLGGTRIPAVALAVHPDSDLLLFTLGQPAPLDGLPLPTAKVATVDLGDTVTYVGFGSRASGGPIGEKYAGTAAVVALSAAEMAQTLPLPTQPGQTPAEALATWTNAWGSSLFYTTTGAAHCGGDSGGLVLVEENETEALVGVISHSYSEGGVKKCPDDASGNVAIAAYLDWLRTEMGATGTASPGQPQTPPAQPQTPPRAGAPPPAEEAPGGCTTGGAARSTWVLVLVFFGWLARRQRRPHGKA